jgi:hypothetical protein
MIVRAALSYTASIFCSTGEHEGKTPHGPGWQVRPYVSLSEAMRLVWVLEDMQIRATDDVQ